MENFYSSLDCFLFADDTTLYTAEDSFDLALSNFKTKFSSIYTWIIYNKLYLNWSKTKFMVLSNNHSVFPKNVLLEGTSIEVVEEFKVLGIILDNKLSFINYISSLKKTVNRKLFSLKKIFFLSFYVKLHFLKLLS